MPNPSRQPQREPDETESRKRKIDLPGDDAKPKELPPARPTPRPSGDRRAGSAVRRKESRG